MGITVDANGVTNSTYAENLASIQADILAINNPIVQNFTFESNSIEGNFSAIVALIAYELGEAFINERNQLNPVTATGVGLDNLQIFYPSLTQRATGTYTTQNVEITTDRAVNLTTDFVVSDSNGNQYALTGAQTITGAGTYTFAFQAVEVGSVTSELNSITIINTPILGVLSVNNSTSATVQGADTETDANFLARMLVARASKNVRDIDAIKNAILGVDGVSYAMVYENDNDYAENGIPARTIYCIVEGGVAANIAEAISENKTGGTPTYGSQSVVLDHNGVYQTIRYDTVAYTDLYARVYITQTGSSSISSELLITYLTTNLVYTVGQTSFAGDFAKYSEDYLGTSGGVTDCDVSLDGITWVKSVDVSALNRRFTLSAENITITIAV